MTTKTQEREAAPQSATPDTAIAVAERPQPPAPKVAVTLGIAPTSLEEGWRLAQMMAKSSLVPKDFRNKPEDVLVAIQLGVEVGLAPMQSLQSIAVINGRPSVWGDGFLALIMNSRPYANHDEYYEVDGQRRDGLEAKDLAKDTTAAVCTFWRHGKPTPTTQRFTVAMAKKAELMGKAGPWQNYPDRMLKLRARSWAGRDAFPDVLRGMVSAEEAFDSRDIPETPAITTVIQPRRASEATASEPITAAPPAVRHDPPAAQPASTLTPEPVAASVGTQAPAAPARSAVSAPPPPIEDLRAVKITKVQFAKPKAGAPYYEISVTGRTVARVFVAFDEQLGKEAESFEGTDHLVCLRWRWGLNGDKERVAIVEALTIDDTNDGLFAN